MQIPDDPFASGGIAEFGRLLRNGLITAERAVQLYLERIEALDCTLNAFEFVAADSALATARAVDALLATGTDLGPLMGVPIAVKDIVAVSGMPTTAGSLLDVTDLIGEEGGFIALLRRAGCIILGKLNTVEFAGGNVGTNYNRKTPRNPWDAVNVRATSGSSSGSAVAVAAGLCAFSIGSDTGGSIRGPAAFCGLVGLKPTVGLWPTDGVLPVSPTFDTLGPLTRTVSDAAIIWATLTNKAVPQAGSLRGVRLGKPTSLFFDNLEPHVAECMNRALETLTEAGADLVEIDIPEFSEVENLFDTIAYAEFIALFGKARFLASKSQMNPDVADLLGHGVEKSTDQYIRSVRRHRELAAKQTELFADIDAWIGPTRHHVAPILPGRFTNLEDHRSLSALCGGATRPANIFGLCATTQPIHQLGSPLPVGLQLMCPREAESKLLGLARAFEAILGQSQQPDVTAFLGNTARTALSG